MATIPIEIVLQDADSPVDPTPTPESGEETNIVVPNTGTISNDGNNSGGISSSIGIILPIVIAILAIVTVIVLIVRKHYKHHKHFSSVMNRKEKLATVVSSTIAILAVTVLVGNLVIPATNAATSVATNVTPGTSELETEAKITIVATRESDNDSDTITATVKNTSYATANLDFGYKVTASMAEGIDNANLYLGGDETSEYYIAPVIDGILTDNTWGYTLREEAEEYLAIPLADAAATIVKSNDNIVENKPVDIYYTIKADKTLPAGTYTGEIEYTLTDNNFPSTLTTMQGMTTEICESTYTPGKQVTDPVPTATLEDIRDHNTYTIAKLADGKCWMTQNLDLNLGSTIEPLTSKNTNLTVAGTGIYADEHYVVDETGMITWTPDNNTITTNLSENWTNSATNPYSYDPGDVYYYTTGDNTNEEAVDKETCEGAHSDGSCAHYHAGNYYNWSAAIASNNSAALGPNEGDQYKNAANSICPAGWELPNGPQESSDLFKNNDFNTLLSSYDGVITGDRPPYCGGLCPFYNYAEGGFNKIRSNPLWLVRSGYVILGSLNNTGGNGYYWYSTVSNSNNAYNLGFDDNNVYPTYDNNRDFGYSVRCVAQ